MMKNKVITTELYEKVEDWYITVRKTDRGTDAFYDLEKEHVDNRRRKSSLQVNETEIVVLFSLLKEILEVKE